jgi:hypothetical protein
MRGHIHAMQPADPNQRSRLARRMVTGRLGDIKLAY